MDRTTARAQTPTAVLRRLCALSLFAVLGCSKSEPIQASKPEPTTPRRHPFEELAASLGVPPLVPSAEQLACRTHEHVLAMPAELPRGDSLPALAMWLPNVGERRLGGLPVLLLEHGAADSEPASLSFRRTPGEVAALVSMRAPALRDCSDQVRRRHAGAHRFDTIVTGLVDPLGRVSEVDARPTDPNDPAQLEFAACVAKAEAPTSSGPWLFRRTPRYTRFELALHHEGRDDFDPRRRLASYTCGRPSSGVRDLDGIATCDPSEATAHVDELSVRASLVTLTEQGTDIHIDAPARPPERELELLMIHTIEQHVTRLAACRPDDASLMDATLNLEAGGRITDVWGANACVNEVLIGVVLPRPPLVGGVDLVELTILWSAPGLGPSAQELELLRDAIGYRGREASPVPGLLAQPDAARLCPPELGLVQGQIAHELGRVGESAEFALHELGLSMLRMDPDRARACLDTITPALLPILTWPAPVDGPSPHGSIGLYEAAARVDAWLAIFTALDADDRTRARLGCFLRRAQTELTGTLELREPSLLPERESCVDPARTD